MCKADDGRGHTVNDLQNVDLTKVKILCKWTERDITTPEEVGFDLALAELPHVLLVAINTATGLWELDDSNWILLVP
jgi:hypothetical protein